MDVGIISDIHGDIEALEAVLQRLDKIHHVETVLCAGDLVGRGPEPDSVVERIRKLQIPTVRGNHDEWSYALSPENKAFLKALPLEWRGQVGGVRVFMCHGKPGNNLWGLYRDHVSVTLLTMMLQSLNANVLITGHTHVPMYMRVDQGCVVNPGSLYTFPNVRSSSHSYGVLHLPEMVFELFDLNSQPVEPLRLET
jgi:putative phosphoesterase